MRLTNEQRQIIRDTVSACDPGATIYLYGSRVHDQLKGGDIDLLVMSQTLTLGDKLNLLVAMKARLGDQRIDLTLHNPQNASQDPFVASILDDALML